MPAVEAVGMWQSRRDFQGVWEGWKAGFLAFHAFHTLSFPWPALETRFTKSQSPRRPVLGTGSTCPRWRLFVQVESTSVEAVNTSAFLRTGVSDRPSA